MNIKEMENRTGLERANIYFYEKEGLITPARLSNGYRDYSEEDYELLMKIKLLRSLHISLEDIRELKEGKLTVRQAMDRQILSLEQEEEKARYAKSLCEGIRKDNPTFSELDGEKYLNTVPEIPKEKENPYFSVPEDQIPYAACPIRRYLARSLDTTLYSTICIAATCFLFNISLSQFDTFGIFVCSFLGLLLMLLVEPLLLRFFGTTLGKWIFGLHIRGVNGKKLPVREGFLRTRQVILHLLILYIPFYSYYHLYRLYNDCVAEYKLPWEKDVATAYTAKMETLWQYIIYMVAMLIIGFLFFFLFFMGIFPPNRGDLTKEEFVENYTFYQSYYQYGFHDAIFNRRTGQWEDDPTLHTSHSEVSVNGSRYDDYDRMPVYLYKTDENGYITQVSFTLTVEEDNPILYLPSSHMHLISMALGGAQKGFSIWPTKSDNLHEAVCEHPFQTRTYTHPDTGLTLEFQYETEGYPTNKIFTSSHAFLTPIDPEQDNFFEMTFSCRKSTQ